MSVLFTSLLAASKSVLFAGGFKMSSLMCLVYLWFQNVLLNICLVYWWFQNLSCLLMVSKCPLDVCLVYWWFQNVVLDGCLVYWWFQNLCLIYWWFQNVPLLGACLVYWLLHNALRGVCLVYWLLQNVSLDVCRVYRGLQNVPYMSVLSVFGMSFWMSVLLTGGFKMSFVLRWPCVVHMTTLWPSSVGLKGSTESLCCVLINVDSKYSTECVLRILITSKGPTEYAVCTQCCL